MRVNILRQRAPDSAPYWEAFEYDGPADTSVAGVLEYINYHDDIINAEGRKTTRIDFECSCLQGVCGGCAMVINGVPALACETFPKDLKAPELTLRPLRKFPVLRDLVVDRTSIHENLTKTSICIGEYQPSGDPDHFHQYTAAKCLKCGLCLEVCPNYTDGRSFFGATFANDSYLVSVRNREKSGEISHTYRQYFGRSCSKSLSCMDVCPVGIPTIASIAKLNRKPDRKNRK